MSFQIEKMILIDYYMWYRGIIFFIHIFFILIFMVLVPVYGMLRYRIKRKKGKKKKQYFLGENVPYIPVP